MFAFRKSRLMCAAHFSNVCCVFIASLFSLPQSSTSTHTAFTLIHTRGCIFSRKSIHSKNTIVKYAHTSWHNDTQRNPLCTNDVGTFSGEDTNTESNRSTIKEQTQRKRARWWWAKGTNFTQRLPWVLVVRIWKKGIMHTKLHTCRTSAAAAALHTMLNNIFALTTTTTRDDKHSIEFISSAMVWNRTLNVRLTKCDTCIYVDADEYCTYWRCCCCSHCSFDVYRARSLWFSSLFFLYLECMDALISINKTVPPHLMFAVSVYVLCRLLKRQQEISDIVDDLEICRFFFIAFDASSFDTYDACSCGIRQTNLQNTRSEQNITQRVHRVAHERRFYHEFTWTTAHTERQGDRA